MCFCSRATFYQVPGPLHIPQLDVNPINALPHPHAIPTAAGSPIVGAQFALSCLEIAGLSWGAISTMIWGLTIGD